MNILDISQKKDKVSVNPCNHQSTYSNFIQIVYNLFTILAILFEYEQTFSKTSYIIFAYWSNLSSDIVRKSKTF